MKIAYLLLLLSCFAFSFSAHATDSDGNERGNGGDEYTKEFLETARGVYARVAKNPIAGVDAAQLAAVIEKTSVGSADRLTLRGVEVDAINYPHPVEPRIVISRAGWDRMATEPYRRHFLVFHEYLGILGVNDRNYEISRQLDTFSVCSRNPAIRTQLEYNVKKFCLDITEADLYFISRLLPTPPEFGTFPAFTLTGQDLAGLANLSFIEIETPLLGMNGDIFVSMPKLSAFHFPFVPHLPKFLAQSELALWIMNQKISDKYLKSIADEAFASLSSLKALSLVVDLRTVNLVRALAGTKSLTTVYLKLKGATIAPADIADAMAGNHSLNFFRVEIPGGDTKKLRLRFVDMGFQCTEKTDDLICTKNPR